MWAFTRSPFVLMFAVLGPLIAVATMGDSRRRARADLRRQREEFDRDFAATALAIDDAHDKERTELERTVGFSAALVVSGIRDSERWRVEAGEQLSVRLGLGTVPSRVVLDDDHATPPERSDGRRNKKGGARQPLQCIDELRERASTLDRAPVVVDARWGIGVCGSGAEATAVATSIAVQLVAALSPMDVDVEVLGDASGVFRWTRVLPHAASARSSDRQQSGGSFESAKAAQLSLRPHVEEAPVILCIALEEQSLPRDCRIVILVAGSRAQVVRRPDGQSMDFFEPDYISHRQAAHFAETLRHDARISFEGSGDALPERVSLGELPKVWVGGDLAGGNDASFGDSASRASLAAAVGIGARGHVVIDLVAEGPHAIVGGTTGSGKSEALVTWVLAIAAAYRPVDVNFLLIDFKGGASFAPVQGLPHTVGVVTDLDPPAARRAILSLQAELRRREQILADAGVRSILDIPRDAVLPRLLIVVDEFAAMTASFPELHDLFADLAARGRSLGIHLILCTQRPAGSIRDAVLANCALRVSLRVNNASDSVAVIGIPDAARIPKHAPGRGLLVRGGSVAEPVQWAVASEDDPTEIAARFRGCSTQIQRPWLDPLPEMLDIFSVPTLEQPAMAFGLADIPEQQRQVPAVYDPASDGNLFIIGGHRSGKSTVLATLAKLASNVVAVPSDVEGAWDTVSNALVAVRAGAAPSLLLLDDLDLTVGKFSLEYEAAFVERLMALAREGPRVGSTLVITASSVRGHVQAVSALCSSTLILRMRDRQDHVLVGGDATEFSAQLPPGGGHWHGHRIQVCFTELSPSPAVPTMATSVPPCTCAFGDSLIIVVSARPAAIRNRLEKIGHVTTLDAWKTHQDDVSGLDVERGSRRKIILGDPDAWLSSFALMGSLRSRSWVIFHDCSLTEFRSLSRSRELPPPLNSPHDTVVVLHPDGGMHRASLDE